MRLVLRCNPWLKIGIVWCVKKDAARNHLMQRLTMIECFFEASGCMSKSLMHVKCEGNRSCGMCGGNIMDPLNFDGSTVVYFYGQQGMPDCAVRVHKRCL